MAQLIYIPITPPQEGCASNCVTIINAGDSIPSTSGPPDGWVFVYTPDGDQVFGETMNDPVLIPEEYANQ